MSRRLIFGLSVLVLSFVIFANIDSEVSAQNYPNKPIRFIVPFAPGGIADVVARIITPKLSESLGQPIVIDNRGGAGGTLGTDIAAKSLPDGYTFVVPAASHTTTPSLYSKLSFDPVKDFVAVAQVVSAPWALVVHPSVQAKSVKEFIELAKSKPGQLNFGSAGNGSSNHLAGELFNIMAGVKTVHVPYKGSGPAMVDLLGGHLSFMFDAINTSIEHIQAGNLRPLAVSTLKRSRIAPDLPTISESGVPGYESATWIGILAPAGTPKEIVTRLNNEIVKVLKLPEIRDRLSKQGTEPVGSTPEEFDKFVKAEIAKWAKVIKDAGIPHVN